MQMPMKDYRPYDASMVGNLPRLVQPTIPEELPMAALPLEGIEDIDLSELEAYLVDEQFNGPELAPSDNTEAAHEFMRIRAGEEVSEFANDLRAQLLEIQMAVEQIRTEPSVYTNPEPHEFGIAIPQDFFEQQKQMLESQFDVLEPPEFDYGTQMEAAFDAQEALFDLFQPEAVPMEEMEPLAGSGSESLEQIIEAHEMLDEGVMPDAMPGALDDDDSLMSPDLFEEEMEPMGLYPDTFEDYGGMMPQEMYDEQMQEDPYMVPGSFGPGPMLDPGPGGPP
jgi:hypothetical protein